MRSVSRPLLHAATFVFLILALPGCAARHDARPWLDDFDALVRHLQTAYANLAWSEANGLDPVALAASARAELESAWTDFGSRRVLAGYLAAFGDPHLRREDTLPDDAAAGDPEPWDAGMSADDVVDALGFEEGDHAFGVDFDDLDGWRPLGDGPFAAGTVEIGGRAFGVLRIDEFGAHRFAAVAEEAWAAWSPAERASSTPSSFFHAVEQRLVDAVAAAARRFRDLGCQGLVVDVTGNGGGNDWYDAVARTLTPRLLHGAPIAFIRHPHWEAELARLLDVVDRTPSRTDVERSLLSDARSRLERALEEVRDPRRTDLVANALFATGVFDHLAPDAFAAAPTRDELFQPGQFAYVEGVWDGPLYVLVDGGSASATEAFAALLRDNDAALLIGEPTLGAGAGYTRGGVVLTLPNSRLRVRAPDLVRLRRSGENERAGLTPDIAFDPSDSPETWLPTLP